MLRISKLADYGIVIMHCLGKQPGQFQSANDIAQQVHLATPTVSKILKLLAEAALVQSIRGSAGGYAISRPADDIKIAAVIAAVEGEPSLTECAHSKNLCSQNSVCAVKHNWQLINHFVMHTLNSISLADMAKPLTFAQLNRE